MINKKTFKHKTYYIRIKFSGDRNMSSKGNRSEIKLPAVNNILFMLFPLVFRLLWIYYKTYVNFIPKHLSF